MTVGPRLQVGACGLLGSGQPRQHNYNYSITTTRLRTERYQMTKANPHLQVGVCSLLGGAQPRQQAAQSLLRLHLRAHPLRLRREIARNLQCLCRLRNRPDNCLPLLQHPASARAAARLVL